MKYSHFPQFLFKEMPSGPRESFGGGGDEPPKNPDDVANAAYQKAESALQGMKAQKHEHPDDQAVIAEAVKAMEANKAQLHADFETRFREGVRRMGEVIDQTAEAVVEGGKATIDFAKERYASFPPEKKAQVDRVVNWVDGQLTEYDTSLQEISEIFANMTDVEQKEFVETFIPGAEIDEALNHGDQMSMAMVVGSVFFGKVKKAKKGVEALQRAKQAAKKVPDTPIVDTKAVYRLEGARLRSAKPKQVWGLLREEMGKIESFDLQKFRPTSNDYMERKILRERFDKEVNARLGNLEVFVRYIRRADVNPDLSPRERASVKGFLKDKALKSLRDMTSKTRGKLNERQNRAVNAMFNHLNQ